MEALASKPAECVVQGGSSEFQVVVLPYAVLFSSTELLIYSWCAILIFLKSEI